MLLQLTFLYPRQAVRPSSVRPFVRSSPTPTPGHGLWDSPCAPTLRAFVILGCLLHSVSHVQARQDMASTDIVAECIANTWPGDTYQAVFAILVSSLLTLSCSPLGSHGCSQEASGHAFVANAVSTHGSTEFLLMAMSARMD